MKTKFFSFIGILVLGWQGYLNYPLIRREISIIRRHINADYDWKMGERIGTNFYSYTQFLKKQVPLDSSILLPPSRFPWPQTGNKYYLSNFLYPRNLISWDKKDDNKSDYILALWGESQPIQEYKPGFPKYDVKGDFIYVKDNNFQRVYKKIDFVFNEDMKEGIWGIIKVRK